MPQPPFGATHPRATPAVLALAGLLAACAAPGGGAPPPGGAAGGQAVGEYDGCGPQVTVFVSAGDLLGGGPAPTTAEGLARENTALDRLQAAFDALVYCRWTEVRLVREAAAVGRLAAPTARARIAQSATRLRGDVTRAAGYRARLAGRATGARPEMALAAVAADTVPLRETPDGSSREVGRVPARAAVRVGPAPHGFALVQTGGMRGFARADAFTRVPNTASEDLRMLAAGNLARREAFAETVALAQRAADTGFEAAL